MSDEKQSWEAIRKASEAAFPMVKSVAHLGHNTKMATRAAAVFMVCINHDVSPEEIKLKVEGVMVHGYSFEDGLLIVDEHLRGGHSIDDIVCLRKLQRL